MTTGNLSSISADTQADINAIQAIEAVPTILATVSAITGLRFVCIARVTCDSWTNCAVLDKLNFGLKVGDALDLGTTLCNEVRATEKAIVIDKVSDDPVYCSHHTPRMYGFESYISIPVYRPNGEYFGTLCGLDPLPAKLKNTAVISSMSLFAQLLSLQLETENKLAETRHQLTHEREAAELREKFVAVLGHDVRNPLGAIINGADSLLREELPPRTSSLVEMMRRSATRIASMIDDVMDFAHGKMGGGIPLQYRYESNLTGLLEQVIAELQSAYPLRKIIVDLESPLPLHCDGPRLAQLFSNLLKNALVHGDPQRPVLVTARCADSTFELCVTNEGNTIPPDNLSDLFKPFWRDSGSTLSGLGLGLFIVAEIARAHGGKVSVISQDQRTTFGFSLRTEPNSPAAQ
jgi:signal transduction histidine kinase